MRKLSKILMPILIVIGSLTLLFIGCRKDDNPVENPPEVPPPPPIMRAFYTVSQDADPTITAVVKSLQKMDVDGSIETKLLVRAGKPYWAKALVVGKAIPVATRGDAGVEDSAKVVLIPFVPEIQTNQSDPRGTDEPIRHNLSVNLCIPI